MGKIFGNGMNQVDLVTLLALMRTNYIGLLAKLDDDATLTDADYESLGTVAMPAGIQTSGSKSIRCDGDVLTFLDNLRAGFAATLTKLDADTGDTTWATDHAVTDTIGGKSDNLQSTGSYQGSLVNFLNKFITKFNALLASLDDDDGIADTNYEELWAVSDTVSEAGTKA